MVFYYDLTISDEMLVEPSFDFSYMIELTKKRLRDNNNKIIRIYEVERNEYDRIRGFVKIRFEFVHHNDDVKIELSDCTKRLLRLKR